MNNVAVSGLTYNEQKDLIEKIARTKAFQHKNIGFYDFEDIQQEVRIKCWNAVSKFKPCEGTNIYVFLSVCAETVIVTQSMKDMFKLNLVQVILLILIMKD
jgi:hypothetical protein